MPPHDATRNPTQHPPDAPHDLGGTPAGPVTADQHDYAPWEKRVDALMMLLGGCGLLKVDELRRNVEALGPEAYDRMSYYERWIASITATLLQRGAITSAEIAAKLIAIDARIAAGDLP